MKQPGFKDYSLKKILLALLAVLITLSACSANAQEAAEVAGTQRAIQNKGSDTLVNLALAWAEQYRKIRPDISIAVTGGGSGTGIAALINGTVDIANASRKMKDKEIAAAQENGIDPIEFTVAVDALAVIVTIPDPRTAREIVAAVRALAPQARLIVRSRFQRACQDLKDAGATMVVDEENTVGRLLAHEALISLELGQDAGLACALAGRAPAVTATPKPDMP